MRSWGFDFKEAAYYSHSSVEMMVVDGSIKCTMIWASYSLVCLWWCSFGQKETLFYAVWVFLLILLEFSRLVDFSFSNGGIIKFWVSSWTWKYRSLSFKAIKSDERYPFEGLLWKKYLFNSECFQESWFLWMAGSAEGSGCILIVCWNWVSTGGEQD